MMRVDMLPASFVRIILLLVMLLLVSGCVPGIVKPVPQDLPTAAKVEVKLLDMERDLLTAYRSANELRAAGIIQEGGEVDKQIGDLIDKSSNAMDEAWLAYNATNLELSLDNHRDAHNALLKLRRIISEKKNKKAGGAP